MRHKVLMGLGVALAAALIVPMVVDAQPGKNPVDGHYPSAYDEFHYGRTNPGTAAGANVANPDGSVTTADGILALDAPNVPGTLWDNGPGNAVNGLTSERRTFTTGTDGPEGDWIGAISEDFETLGSGDTLIEEVRTCMYSNPTEAEIWFWEDAGDNPPSPPSAANLFRGSPADAGFNNNAGANNGFFDNGARCGAAFGFPGRQFQFNPQTTGAPLDLWVFPPGTYWVTSVGGPNSGGAAGGRAF